MGDTTVTLDVGGVGYEVMLPAIEMKTLRARLQSMSDGRRPTTDDRPPTTDGGQPTGGEGTAKDQRPSLPAGGRWSGGGGRSAEVEVHIYYHVNERQPTPMLIGFTERQSREFFRALLTVAEVGPAPPAKALTI